MIKILQVKKKVKNKKISKKLIIDTTKKFLLLKKRTQKIEFIKYIKVTENIKMKKLCKYNNCFRRHTYEYTRIL